MNNRLISIIVEYFDAFKDDYIISINGNENASYIVADNRVSYKMYDSDFWTIIKADEIAEVITTATRLTILTNFSKQYCFTARQKTNEEKINELVDAITERLVGREELNMIKEYLDELKGVCGKN